LIVFDGDDEGTTMSIEEQFRSVCIPYVAAAVLVLAVAAAFCPLSLPEVLASQSQKRPSPSSALSDDANHTTTVALDSEVESELDHRSSAVRPLYARRHFVLGVLAQFLYVACQTGINSFFINYVVEATSLGDQDASLLLSLGGMVLFFLGRLTGSLCLMNWIRPQLLLSIYAVASCALLALVMAELGYVSVVSLCFVYLFESIMFPTIFALSLHGLHPTQRSRASSVLVMSIVGGAFLPPLMGLIGDHSSMAIAFVAPLLCLIYIAFFGLWGYKVAT
jgi:FHS family L-fucose permease-like MFS transporter